jgi:nitrous oxidase accessory protein
MFRAVGNKIKCFLILIGLSVQCAVHAEFIQVGAGKTFSTIKSALAAAKPGDVILIHKGIYSEGEIIVDKPVTLRGVNYPVLDGKNNSQIVRVMANGVVIEGLDIRNAGYSSMYDWAAVRVVNSRHVIIRNNRLFNNAFGIYFQNTANSQIVNNFIKGNTVNEINSGNAIHCWKSDSLNILNNTVTGHRDGLYFEFVTNSLIRNNSSHNNLRYGIHFMFSHDDTYIHNLFKQNGAGVAVMFSKRVVMRWNRFEENWGSAAYGIMLKEINDGVVEYNTFIQNTVGIYMEGTSRLHVSKNIFKNNGWAMRVQSSCTDNIISSNNYLGNTFDVATNGRVQLNRFEENYWDKYEGYDLNKDGYGDVHYLPVSLYSMIVEKIPAASMLLKSFMVNIMDKAERLIPGITPVELKDDRPLMKPVPL